MERTEMRMVRWIADISLLEMRQSADNRRMCGICSVKKAREARLNYFGHVKRREDGPVMKAMMAAVMGEKVLGDRE